MKFKKIIKKHT